MRILGALLVSGLAVAEEGRPLSMETVDHVIEQHDRSVQACGRGGKKGAQAVQLMLEIDAAGVVTLAQPIDDEPGPEAQCLSKLARRLKFPSTGVTTKLAYPFMLLRR